MSHLLLAQNYTDVRRGPVQDDDQVRWSLSTKLFYTVSQKSSPFKLCVTLSNLNRFSTFLDCLKAYEICYKNPHDITHPTLGMLLQYLGKLKIQIFCRYSADIEDNGNLLLLLEICVMVMVDPGINSISVTCDLDL